MESPLRARHKTTHCCSPHMPDQPPRLHVDCFSFLFIYFTVVIVLQLNVSYLLMLTFLWTMEKQNVFVSEQKKK